LAYFLRIKTPTVSIPEFDILDQQGRGLHLSYKDKLRIVALTKQVIHGKYRPDVSPDVGFLDVVGNDRK